MKKISIKKTFLLILFLLVYSFIISFSFGYYLNDYNYFKTSINFVKLKDTTSEDLLVDLPDEGYTEIGNQFEDIVKENITINLGDKLPDITDYFIKIPENINDLKLDYYKNGKKISVNYFANLENEEYFSKTIGSYDVFVGGYVSELSVLDLEKPVVTFKNLSVYEDSFFSIKEFIDTYVDNSGSSSFISIIKNNNEIKKKPGTYNISIMVCDESMNCVDGTAKLTVLKKVSSGSQTPQNPNTSTPGNSGSSGSSGSSGGSSNEGNSDENGNSSGNTSGNNGENNDNPPSSTNPDTPVIDPNDPEIIKPSEGPVTYVKDIEVKEIVSRDEIKYGVNKVGYIYAIYELYSDGSKRRKNATEVYYEIDYSSFNASISQMKPEAIDVYGKTENTRNYFLSMTNQYRSEVGANNLVLDETLCIMATIRAIEIAYSRQFSHTRPDGSQWNTVIKDSSFNFKTSFAGENLAGNFANDETAMLGLRRSTGHYNTMINSKFNKLGIGVYTFNGQTYWVQLFAA